MDHSGQAVKIRSRGGFGTTRLALRIAGLKALCGARPDAPGFFNLVPGTWTRAPPPRQDGMLGDAGCVVNPQCGRRKPLIVVAAHASGLLFRVSLVGGPGPSSASRMFQCGPRARLWASISSSVVGVALRTLPVRRNRHNSKVNLTAASGSNVCSQPSAWAEGENSEPRETVARG